MYAVRRALAGRTALPHPPARAVDDRAPVAECSPGRTSAATARSRSPGYGRAVLEEEATQLRKIDEAIAVVVRDVRAFAPEMSLAATRDEVSETNGLEVSWRGNRGWCAIEVEHDQPAEQFVRDVAACVQDSETLFYEYYEPWPVCAVHGAAGGHSLDPQVRAGAAWWCCPTVGPVTRVGDLQATG